MQQNPLASFAEAPDLEPLRAHNIRMARCGNALTIHWLNRNDARLFPFAVTGVANRYVADPEGRSLKPQHGFAETSHDATNELANLRPVRFSELLLKQSNQLVDAPYL
jgi:hypothetical protein